MRWSLFSLITLLVVLVVDVTALPIPQDDSEPILERRTKKVAKAPKPPKTPKSLKAGNFKKASKTYRNAALKSTNAMLAVNGGKIVKQAPPTTMPTGMDADHIFEAQTMKIAAERSGHTLATLAPAMDELKDRINDPKNMGFLDPTTNRAKGNAHTAVLAGNTPAKDPKVVDALKATSAIGKATAADLDKILASHGITGVNVLKAHKEVLKAHGVTRREYSEIELD